MGVGFAADALKEIYRLTQGYPYFLQEWGYQSWNLAEASPITVDVVKEASPSVVVRLDKNFFRVRFDRLTPSEKRYLRGMADLGEGPFASTAIADHIGRKPSSFGPVRASLIAKGMIYTPGYGETAFTVPMFGAFMRRAMPVGDAGADQGE